MASVDVKMKGVVQVGDSVLRVRTRPSLSGTIIGRLPTGYELTITQQDGEWYYATNTGGWSHSDYITITERETISQDRTVVVDKEEQERLTTEAEQRNMLKLNDI